MNNTTPVNPSKKTPITINWEAITPTRAKLWIKQTDESPFQQRTLGSGTVKKYIGEMKRGDWHSGTADIIRIGECEGREVVIDGQHRLMGIAASEIAQDMFVARNVPLDAFKYIDQGNNRTLKDVMDCAGWQDSTTISSGARYLWVYGEAGTPFGQVRPERNLSAGSLFDWVEEYTPEIKDVWVSNKKLIREARKGIKMSESIMFFLWMKFSALDEVLAGQAFHYFSEPLAGNGSLSANFKYALEYIAEIQWEMKEMTAKGLRTRSDEHRDPCTKALIMAWNSTRTGKCFRSKNGIKKELVKSGNDVWAIK
jgi:hypothetical protein